MSDKEGQSGQNDPSTSKTIIDDVEPQNSNSNSNASWNRTKPGKLSDLASSPGVKFIITGLITLFLTIPALLVWGLVEERADRADQVAQSISQGWGNQQRINGPYLVVPYMISEKVSNGYRDVKRFAIYSPDKLISDSNLSVEERKKAIYSTPLYHMKSKLSGTFLTPDLSIISQNNGRAQPDEAFIVIEVSDLAGFRSQVTAKLDGQDAVIFKPGMAGLRPSRQSNAINNDYRSQKGHSDSAIAASGIHLNLTQDLLKNDLSFEIDLAINGSRILELVPSGKSTKATMTSNWPHPGFDGRFLPETRIVTEEGFEATWTIPNLARGISAVSLSSAMVETNSVIKVNFVKPLKFYQLVSRTLRYAVAFFSLVFLAIFILELTGKQPIHWIQYILTGLAMVVFYILLLALAEQIGFGLAYLIAGFATTGLVSWYVGNALASAKVQWLLAAIIGLIYTIMYLLLNEDEYALLIGAIIAFVAIAMTMVATRKVDWSNS
jgi:inner membrane protein